MFFFPIGCFVFLLLILLLPLLFFLIFFNIISFSFEKLGFSPEATFLIILLILLGSVVNIPLTRRKKVYVRRDYFFGLFPRKEIVYQGVAVNLGGALIPLSISFYLLEKVPWQPTLIATILMIAICFSLSRIVPGQGIALPAVVPPVFSALFALILAPNFAAPVAFISGIWGALIGADILNIKKVLKTSPGMLSIGGAGVFDGIFLVGIVSVFLTAI